MEHQNDVVNYLTSKQLEALSEKARDHAIMIGGRNHGKTAALKEWMEKQRAAPVPNFPRGTLHEIRETKKQLASDIEGFEKAVQVGLDFADSVAWCSRYIMDLKNQPFILSVQKVRKFSLWERILILFGRSAFVDTKVTIRDPGPKIALESTVQLEQTIQVQKGVHQGS